MSDQSFIARIGEQIQLHANAKHVYGEPVERDGTTIIPVARVQWGFGGGGFGRGVVEHGGGGGGVRAFPTGFIELREGKAEFRPIHDPGNTGTLLAAGAAGLILGVMLARLTRR